MMGSRKKEAADGLSKLITKLLPPGVWAAHLAAQEERWSDAIIELDRYLTPAPSATATNITSGNSNPFKQRDPTTEPAEEGV